MPLGDDGRSWAALKRSAMPCLPGHTGLVRMLPPQHRPPSQTTQEEKRKGHHRHSAARTCTDASCICARSLQICPHRRIASHTAGHFQRRHQKLPQSPSFAQALRGTQGFATASGKWRKQFGGFTSSLSKPSRYASFSGQGRGIRVLRLQTKAMEQGGMLSELTSPRDTISHLGHSRCFPTNSFLAPTWQKYHSAMDGARRQNQDALHGSSPRRVVEPCLVSISAASLPQCARLHARGSGRVLAIRALDRCVRGRTCAGWQALLRRRWLRPVKQSVQCQPDGSYLMEQQNLRA